jgi:DNA (cytosine-5)-methyltransferase 1
LVDPLPVDLRAEEGARGEHAASRRAWDQRFVIDSPKPFIVQYHTAKRPGDDRIASLDAPLGTQTVENRFGIVAPVLAGVGGRAGQSPERSLEQPYQTITAKADAAIITPHLVSLTHHGGDRVEDLAAPFATITGAHRGEKALIAPTLIQTGYGEDKKRNNGEGQPPRALDLEAPLGTVVGGGVKHALVNAFLAKHQSERHDGEVQGSSLHDGMPTIKTRDSNALVTAALSRFNGDRIGQELDEPLGTVMASTAKHALVASNLVKLHGTTRDGQSVDRPMSTVLAGGNHIAEVRAFLTTYYGNAKQGHSLNNPLPTATAHDRFGLVTIEGHEYVIADIGMRMLAPRELYRAQGFPDSYRIDIDFKGKPMTKTAQVRMCGNSVCPPLAAALVAANASPATFMAGAA